MPVEFGISYDWIPSPYIVALQFEAFGLDIRSYHEPLKRSIQQVMAPSLGENFAVGGRPPWQPLSPYTIEKKGHDEILIESGTLWDVAQQLNIWTISRYEAYIDSFPRAEYGRFHQTGTKNMPQREFLLIQPEDEDNIVQVFEDWIGERLAARGLGG